MNELLNPVCSGHGDDVHHRSAVAKLARVWFVVLSNELAGPCPAKIRSNHWVVLGRIISNADT